MDRAATLAERRPRPTAEEPGERGGGDAGPVLAPAEYRSLVEQVPVVTYVELVDDAGTLTYVSPQVETLFGVPAERWLADPWLWLELLHPDDRERVVAEHQRSNQTGDPVRIEYRMVVDGRTIWVRSEARLPRHPDGTPRHWQGMLLDITERKEAEEALRRSEARFRAMVRNAPDLITILDAEGRIRYQSPAAERLLGRRSGQWLGTDAFALTHPEDRPRLVARFAEARRRPGIALTDTYRIQHADGSWRWFESVATNLLADPSLTGIVINSRDVTERREAELARGRLARELALLEEVRTALAREVELGVLFRTVVEATARVFGYRHVSLFLIEGEDLVLQHHVGYGDAVPSIPIGRGVVGRVARTGVPSLVEDPAADPEFFATIDGVSCAVCVPLRADGRVVGVLSVESVGDARLGPADLRLLGALSEHVEIALARARAYAELAASETRFRGAFDHAPIGMALVGLDGRFLLVNRALCTMVDYGEAELLALDFQAITHPDDLAADIEQARRLVAGEADGYTLEKRYRQRTGRIIWAQVSVSLVRDEEGTPRYFISQIEDITARKALEERLHHLALHDPLTGLPNRAYLLERLERALAAGSAAGTADGAPPVVLLLDLDGFKLVNDSLGHDAGDRLLAAAAERLRAALRPVDTIARLGGDEFAIVLGDGGTGEAAGAIAERVTEVLRPGFRLDGHDTFVSASVGIAVARPGESTPRDLLREADTALYAAKAAGRGTYARFEPWMTDPIVARLEHEHALRRAIQRREFRLLYQPVVDVASGGLVGFEALVRWEHPTLGLLRPADFVLLAEETGTIVPIGRWALAEACRQLCAWRERFPAAGELSVGVNLSFREFREPDLADDLARLLAETGLPADRLELEITERVVMGEDAGTAAAIAALAKRGVRLVLDDFGTGCSSLAYVCDLPLRGIKIDHRFVQRLPNAGAEAVIRAVTTLAADLDLLVTAEGIETEKQLDRLRELNVARGQGYLLSRPLPAKAVEAMLAAPGDGSESLFHRAEVAEETVGV